MGFDQDFSRHHPAFVSQILNQTIHGLDNTPVQHPVLMGGLYILPHRLREGPKLPRRIPPAASREHLFERAVLINY
jgi:hypothetical protein